MKVRIFFKTPDAVDYALEDIEDEDEKEEVKQQLSKYIKYEECVTLELDTETGKMEVLPV
jgi:hypothetical protein